MEKTEQFHMGKCSKKTGTNTYAAPMRGVVNKATRLCYHFYTMSFFKLIHIYICVKKVGSR